MIHLASANIGDVRVATFLQEGQIRAVRNDGEDDYMSIEEASALGKLLLESVDRARLAGACKDAQP